MDKFQNKYRIHSARMQNWDYGWNAPYYVTICTLNRELFFGDIADGKMKLSETGKLAAKFLLEIPRRYEYAHLDEFVVMPNHVHAIVIIDKIDDGRFDGIYNYDGGNGCVPGGTDGGDGLGLDGDGRGVDGDDGRGVECRDAINRVSTDAQPRSEPDAQPRSEPDPQPRSEPDAQPGSEPEPETKPGPNFQSNPPTNPNTPRHQKQRGGITGNKNPMLHDNLSRIINWYKGRVTFESRKINAGFAWQSRFHDHIIRNNAEYLRIKYYIINNPKNWKKDRLNK